MAASSNLCDSINHRIKKNENIKVNVDSFRWYSLPLIILCLFMVNGQKPNFESIFNRKHCKYIFGAQT